MKKFPYLTFFSTWLLVFCGTLGAPLCVVTAYDLPHHLGTMILAAALISGLAQLILQFDKVPFYCCAWSNLKSANNAIKSGFRPAWVEMTVKPAPFVDGMNQ